MYELNFKSWACIILTGLFLVVGGVGSCTGAPRFYQTKSCQFCKD